MRPHELKPVPTLNGGWALNHTPMTIQTQKLPTFPLYVAYADEFGVTTFGSCRDEALNNLMEELLLVEQAAGAGKGKHT